MSIKITVRAHFEKGYIADPYWPEREKVINILKESGANRVRSQDRRAKALDDYLRAKSMTLEDLRQLEALAERPFYMNSTHIIIPAHQVHGCLAEAAALCSSSIRIARQEQIRTVLQSSDWETGKAEADGIWERFVVVKSGTGKTLTNQRALRANPYIEDFDATGTLTTLMEKDGLRKLRDFIEWAGREIGMGASRKMGWGRFAVTAFDLDTD
jgi:hypothetical protein